MAPPLTSPSNHIEIPNNWEPRAYQLPVWQYLEAGGKRVLLVWHRRSGKDSVGLNWTAWAAHQRIGTYWHLLPTQRQARKVIWEAINPDTSMRLIDQVFPKQIRKQGNDGKREDEMLLRLQCGSNWQLAGSDNYDALVGANVVGVVFSEWALCDPQSWDYVRPILAENGGWAMFITTPRGRNHAYEMSKMAESNEAWCYSFLTVRETKRRNGEYVISDERIEEERNSGMSPQKIEQEYYCSFDAPLEGAYYARQMSQALKDKRITEVPYDTHIRVETWWDLGFTDSTSIWFVQRVGKAIHLIDYYENSGEDLAHYAKVLDEKPYLYSDHVFPHDVKAKELGTGQSREEVLKRLGVKVRLAPNLRVQDGIEAVRGLIPKCYFDKVKCDRGVEALRQYRKEWDDKNKIYHNRPLHDWTSHAADAFRMGAVMQRKLIRGSMKPSPQPEIKVI